LIVSDLNNAFNDFITKLNFVNLFYYLQNVCSGGT